MRFGSIKLTRYNPVWLVIDPPSIYRESAACDVVCTGREKETHSTGHLHSGEEGGRCGGVGGKRREGGVGVRVGRGEREVWGVGGKRREGGVGVWVGRGRCGGVGGKREVWRCGWEEEGGVGVWVGRGRERGVEVGGKRERGRCGGVDRKRERERLGYKK